MFGVPSWRLLTATVWVLLATSVSGQVTPASSIAPACNAPTPASRLSIPRPSCQQRWAYYLNIQQTLRVLSLYGQILDTRITGREIDQEVWALVIEQAETVADLPKTKEVKRWVTTKFVDVAISALPENNVKQEVAKVWAQTIADIAWEAADPGSKPEQVRDLVFKLAELTNQSLALSDTQALLAKRLGLQVASTYLSDFYRFGGDSKLVAQKYGLASTATLQSVLGAVAKQTIGTDRTGYSIISWLLGYYDFSYTVGIIGSTSEAVQAQIEPCIAGQCRYAPRALSPVAAASAIPPPSSVTYQPANDIGGQDIWTTSLYSNAPGGGGPGGGLNNDTLQVGGWGDEYRSLIQFDLSEQTLPKRPTSVILRLYDYAAAGVNPNTTPMTLFRISQFWDWRTQGTGSDRLRLWWVDQPGTVQIVGAGPRPTVLPAPTLNAFYDIDITDIYNSWQADQANNFGLELRPTVASNTWNFFYSSNYVVNPALRPQLIIVGGTVTSGTPPPLLPGNPPGN